MGEAPDGIGRGGMGASGEEGPDWGLRDGRIMWGLVGVWVPEGESVAGTRWNKRQVRVIRGGGIRCGSVVRYANEEGGRKEESD